MPKKKRTPKEKKTRRARGTGSIFFDQRRNQWVGRAPVGARNGRTLYREVRAATQARVVELLRKAEPPGPDTTVAAWCDRWLESLTVRPQTRDLYEQSVRLRIKPQLGHLNLAKLSTFGIEEAAQRWGREVSAASVRKAMNALSVCLQAAVRADAIPRNPARAAKRPTVPKVKMDIFTPDELRQIVAAATANPKWRVFAPCAAAGIRIGESLALRPESFDPTTGLLSITRTKTREHGMGEPKSAASLRTIRVPKIAHAALVAGFAPCSYVAAFNRWARLLEHLKLRYRNIHQLKHSVATHLIAAGVPIADVAAYLGDVVAVLVRTYLHPSGADPCVSLEKLLGGSKVAPKGGKVKKTRGKRKTD
jgi:integrase